MQDARASARSAPGNRRDRPYFVVVCAVIRLAAKLRSMKVFLDTGPFHDNIYAKGEPFDLLADGIAQGWAEVFVSDVVIQEVVNQVRKRIEKAKKAIEASADELQQLTGAYDTPELPDSKVEVSEFETKFRDRLEELGIKMLPLPSLNHSELLERDKQNRKPFSEGRGYRDALIWESILAHIKNEPDDFILVTTNARDFGGKSAGTLHPDLVQDIRSLSEDIEGRLRASIKDFVDSEIKPKLKSVEELKKALQRGTYKPLDVEQLVGEHLDELAELPDSKLRIYVSDFDLDDPVTIQSAENLEGIEVVDVLERTSGLIYVEGNARCSVTIDGYVYKSDAYNLEEQGRIHVTDWHWNEHYAAVEVGDVPMVVTFSFTFNRDNGEVKSFEFLRAEAV